MFTASIDPEPGVQVGVYTSARTPFHRAAIFPHGSSHKPKIRVISSRAIKQICELTRFQASPDAAVSTAVLFLVNRSDCATFRPCHEACPLFAQVLLSSVCSSVCSIKQDRHLPTCPAQLRFVLLAQRSMADLQ